MDGWTQLEDRDGLTTYRCTSKDTATRTIDSFRPKIESKLISPLHSCATYIAETSDLIVRLCNERGFGPPGSMFFPMTDGSIYLLFTAMQPDSEPEFTLVHVAKRVAPTPCVECTLRIYSNSLGSKQKN